MSSTSTDCLPHAGTGKSVKQGLQVHPDFPYVTAAVMQGGTPDFIVGVTQLRLCNGDKWYKRMRVCTELFSAGTASMIPDRASHSVQGRNCSFGYFEFRLMRKREIDPSPDSCSCQPKSERYITCIRTAHRHSTPTVCAHVCVCVCIQSHQHTGHPLCSV